MTKWLHLAIFASIAASHPLPCFAQCGFAIERVTQTHWYRNDGWQPPGLGDAKAIGPLHLTINGGPKAWPEGITASLITHDDGYRVVFPEAKFDEDGVAKKMQQRIFLLYRMLRWESNGTPYAYSYELGPLDVACMATVDIIDDRGDGKFRLMTSPGHVIFGPNAAPPPVPEWLGKPKS